MSLPLREGNALGHPEVRRALFALRDMAGTEL